MLDQSELIEVEELVKDVLPTLENDFGIKLTVFFGNGWSKLQANDLQAYFDEETKLFSDVSHYRGNERVATFSEMLLLDFARHLDIPTIKHKILQSIDDSRIFELSLLPCGRSREILPKRHKVFIFIEIHFNIN